MIEYTWRSLRFGPEPKPLYALTFGGPAGVVSARWALFLAVDLERVTEVSGVLGHEHDMGDIIWPDGTTSDRGAMTLADLVPEGVEGKRGRFRVVVSWTPELLRLRRPLRNRRLLFIVRLLRAHSLQFLGREVAQVQREPDTRLRRRLGPASRRRDLVGHAAR